MPLISKPPEKKILQLPLALRLVVMSDRLLHTELVRVYFFSLVENIKINGQKKKKIL